MSEECEKFFHRVSPEESGERIDKFLSRLLPQYSRAYLQTALEQGSILLNSKQVKNKYELAKDDLIQGEIKVIKPEEPAQAQDIALEIIYQDSEIAVINKPIGLIAHPGAGNPDGTLLNALLNAFPDNRNLARAGIIHRLDKDTSGLLVVAKTLTAQTDLTRQLASRSMGREYLALVFGAPTTGGTIDAPIARHPQNRLKMAIRPDGRTAITHYRIQERLQNFTLLALKLETGRTHQIRVHLSSKHLPIVGDQLYSAGVKSPKNTPAHIRLAVENFPRQALHAQKLRLTHPVTQEEMEFLAPLPSDFANLLDLLRIEQKTPSKT